MGRFPIAAILLLAGAQPAFAQETAPAAAAATAAAPEAKPQKPKKICRTFRVTGRRISETSCYTAAQWADYDRTNQTAANRFVNDVTGAGAKSNLSVGSSGSLDTSSMFGLGNPQ